MISALGVVFSIPYPEFYNDLLEKLRVLSLDFIEAMPLDCTIPLNHNHYLLLRTLIPLAILLVSFLARRCLQAAAAQKSREAEATQGDRAKKLERKACANAALADLVFTLNFVLFYLLFPSTSANIFATLQCITLDDPERTSFLRKDFSVDCKTPFHQGMRAYAIVMIAVYPIGIPATYTYLLFVKHGKEMWLLRSLELERDALGKEARAANNLVTARTKAEDAHTSITSLAAATLAEGSARRRPAANAMDAAQLPAEIEEKIDKLKAEEDKVRKALPDYVKKLIVGYELRVFYFEILECLRKLAIVCLPVFFSPTGSVSQLMFGLMVCFLTVTVLALIRPYKKANSLAIMAQVTPLPH